MKCDLGGLGITDIVYTDAQNTDNRTGKRTHIHIIHVTTTNAIVKVESALSSFLSLISDGYKLLIR